MEEKHQHLQDPFLNTLRKEHVPLSMFLVNGIKLMGTIESFDQYVVMLRGPSGTQLIYKHAIDQGVLTLEVVQQGSMRLCSPLSIPATSRGAYLLTPEGPSLIP